MRHFKIHTWPQVKYFGKKVAGTVYCSRTDTIKELINKICGSATFSKNSNHTSDELASSCRLWKMEGDETIEDVESSLDAKNFPNEVPGRILYPYQLVQDVNVADGEPLVLEWKIALERKA